MNVLDFQEAEVGEASLLTQLQKNQDVIRAKFFKRWQALFTCQGQVQTIFDFQVFEGNKDL